MNNFDFLGPSATPWGRILHHLDAWRMELNDIPHVLIPSKQDPFKAIGWLLQLEKKYSDHVDDAAAKLARFPRRRIPELDRDGLFLLRERIRIVHPVIEAMSTVWKQATKPVHLFDVPEYEGVEEQQILWALVSFWHELGCNRWTNEYLGNFHYAASLHGWRPDKGYGDEKPKTKKPKQT
jgi:hypothetical protein